MCITRNLKHQNMEVTEIRRVSLYFIFSMK